jgi:hypothetical protein
VLNFRKNWDIMLLALVFTLLVAALVSWLALVRHLDCGPVRNGVAQCEKINRVYGIELSRHAFGDVSSASIESWSRNHNPTTRIVLHGSQGAQPFRSGFVSAQRDRREMAEAVNSHLQSGSTESLQLADRSGWPAATVTALFYLATLLTILRRQNRSRQSPG